MTPTDALPTELPDTFYFNMKTSEFELIKIGDGDESGSRGRRRERSFHETGKKALCINYLISGRFCFLKKPLAAAAAAAAA